MNIATSMIAAVAFLLSQFTFSHEHSSPVETHIVNGIQVHLINTRHGNAFTLATVVLSGLVYDDPVRHPGLAHLFEHFIHSGSTAFPGAATYNRVAQSIGGDSNAHTADNHVLYYFRSHPDAFLEAARFQGAMISEPEWNEGAFLRERQVVINEAQEYMSDDSWVLEYVLRLVHFPDGHPMKMYDLGTHAQLSALTIDDLRGLYRRAYTPKSMHVIVAGNFDPLPGFTKPALDKATALDGIRNHYFPQPIDPTLVAPTNQHFPDITDQSPTVRWIEVGTPSQSSSIQVMFQVDVPAEPSDLPVFDDALQIVVDFLNLDGPGTVQHLLQSSGLASGLVAEIRNLNRLRLVTLAISPTDRGAKKRLDLMALLLNALGTLKANGLNPDAVRFLVDRSVASLASILENSEETLDTFVEALTRSSDPRLLANTFNYRERFGLVTPAAVRQALQSTFSLSQMVGGYLGPDIHSAEIQPEFGRPLLRLTPSARQTLTHEWSKLLIQPSVVADLGNLPKPKLFSGSPLLLDGVVHPPALVVHGNGLRVVHEEIRTAAHSALWLQWEFPHRHPKEASALAIFAAAANHHFASEWGGLEQFGVEIELVANAADVSLRLTGPGHLLLEIAAHYWDQLRQHYTVSAEDVEIAQAEILDAAMEDKNGFSATIAHETISVLLAKNGSQRRTLQKLGAHLTPNEVQTHWHQLFAHGTDLSVAAVGALDRQILIDWATRQRSSETRTLTPGQRSLRASPSFFAGHTPVVFWSKLNPIKSEDAFGVNRAYTLYSGSLRDFALSLVLTEMLSHQINNRNLIEHNLGYIHTAKMKALFDQVRILFFGQTEEDQPLEKIVQGWTEVLHRWTTKTISESEFQNALQGVRRSAGMLATSREDRLDQLMTWIDQGQPLDAQEGVLAALDTLTLTDVIHHANQHLVGKPYVQVVVARTKPICEEQLVTRIQDARERLMLTDRPAI